MTLSNLSSRGTLRGTIYRGGGGGITDYNFLSGKPQINGVTVENNHDGGYYGLIDSADIEVTEIYEIGYGSNYDVNLNGAAVHVTNKIFKGATNSANGTKGLVPAPAAGSVGKILSNEGWIDPPTALPQYSTSEQKTGQKWIDGKDIYFKTISYPYSILSSGSSYTIDTINNINLKRADGMIIEESTGYTYYLPYAQSAGTSLYYYNNDLIFSIGSGTSFSSGRIELTIYYTKA